MSVADEKVLRTFERKILRRIYGPIKENKGWRIRTNNEIEVALEGEDIVRFIKSQRLAWLGHVERMNEERILKKLLHTNATGRRRRGRPRKTWKKDVEEDLRIMRIAGWRERERRARRNGETS